MKITSSFVQRPYMLLAVTIVALLGACSYSTEPTPASLFPPTGSTFLVERSPLVYNTTNQLEDTVGDSVMVRFAPELVQSFGGRAAYQANWIDSAARPPRSIDSAQELYSNLPDGDVAFLMDTATLRGFASTYVPIRPTWVVMPFGSKVVHAVTQVDTMVTVKVDTITYSVAFNRTITSTFDGPDDVIRVNGGQALQTIRSTTVIATRIVNPKSPVPYNERLEIINWYSPKLNTVVKRWVILTMNKPNDPQDPNFMHLLRGNTKSWRVRSYSGF